MSKNTTKELEVIIKKEITPVLDNVSQLKVESADDIKNATVVLSKVNQYADYLKTDRLALTAPLEESLKLIRAKYTPTESMLKEAVATIKEKMSSYQMKLMAEQKKQEDKIANDLANGKIKKTETAIRKMGEVEVAEKKVLTDEGSASFKTIRDFEVMDIVMLANANKDAVVANDVYIRNQMKAGVELAGVRYFDKLSVVNRR